MIDTDEIKKRPAFQFYPADWRKDVELRSCSLAARGLWIDLMCVMHECDPYGHLMINGQPMTPAKIAGQIGVTPAQVKKLLDELMENGVARKTAEGAIYSKRMVDDERVRNARAAGGKAGAEHGAKGAEYGNKGGRPPTTKGGSITPLDVDFKPPPSSSSSSSSSNNPHTPKGAGPVGLKTWIAAVKANGEQPIPSTDAVFAYAKEVGIPDPFLHLAWREFLHRYSQPDAKRYRDWRIVFRKAVRGNWLKLWWLDGQQYTLTTAGVQAQRAHQEKTA